VQIRSAMQEMARLTQQHPRDGRLVQSPDEP
jgi:hypothetical protein